MSGIHPGDYGSRCSDGYSFIFPDALIQTGITMVKNSQLMKDSPIGCYGVKL